MRPPLLVLFTGNAVPGVRDAFGDFDAHFRARIGDGWDHGWATADARDEAAPLPTPSAFAGVLVTGSSHSVTERAPWMLRLEAWLRQAVADETPLLGVCFGHQILGQALGGQVLTNVAGRRLGTVDVTRSEDDPLFDGLPQTFRVNVSHRDHVAVPPPSVRGLARAPHDALHAFAAGPNARGVQFHPEFDQGIVRGYIDARRGVLADEGHDADALHRSAEEAPSGRVVLRNFVRHFASKPGAGRHR